MTEHARQSIRLLAAKPHDCPYIDGNTARDVIVDPDLPLDGRVYSQILAQGFRRSGDYLYRPQCPSCRACKASRVLADQFVPSRAQKRCLKTNQSVEVTTSEIDLKEHFAVFQQYTQTRHTEGGMDKLSLDEFATFLTCGWQNPQIWSFRENGQLIGGAIVDNTIDAYSAVYSYFLPELKQRSLGVFIVLAQIQQAQANGKPYVYLGYQIDECDKMKYKTRFQPIELFNGKEWLLHQSVSK